MNRVQNAVSTAVADAGFTLEAAAAELGLPETYLLDYVTRRDPGQLPPDVRRALVRLTGVPPYVFVGADPTPAPAFDSRAGRVQYVHLRHLMDRERKRANRDADPDTEGD